MNDATLSAVLLEKLKKYRVTEPFGWTGILVSRMSFNKAFQQQHASAASVASISLSPSRRGSAGFSPGRQKAASLSHSSTSSSASAVECEMNLSHLAIPDSVACAIFETVQAALLLCSAPSSGHNSNNGLSSSASSLSPSRRVKEPSRVWDDSAAARSGAPALNVFVTLRLCGNLLTGAVVPALVSLLSSTSRIRSLDLTENKLDAASVTTLTNTVHSLAVRPNLFVDSAALLAIKQQQSQQYAPPQTLPHFQYKNNNTNNNNGSSSMSFAGNAGSGGGGMAGGLLSSSVDPLQDVSAISSGAASNRSADGGGGGSLPTSGGNGTIQNKNSNNNTSPSRQQQQHRGSVTFSDDEAVFLVPAAETKKGVVHQPQSQTTLNLEALRAQRDTRLAAEAARFSQPQAAPAEEIVFTRAGARPESPRRASSAAAAPVTAAPTASTGRAPVYRRNDDTSSFADLPLPLIRHNDAPPAHVSIRDVQTVKLVPRPMPQLQQQQQTQNNNSNSNGGANYHDVDQKRQRSASPQPGPVVPAAAPAASTPRAASTSQPGAAMNPPSLSSRHSGYADIAREKQQQQLQKQQQQQMAAPLQPQQQQQHLPDMVSVHDIMMASSAQHQTTTSNDPAAAGKSVNHFADILDHLDISIGMPHSAENSALRHQNELDDELTDSEYDDDADGNDEDDTTATDLSDTAAPAGAGVNNKNNRRRRLQKTKQRTTAEQPWLRARSLTMLSESVRSGIFRNLTLLELRGLRLHELPPHLPPGLLRLDVSRNEISTLRGIGDSCPHLEVINARRNKITAIGAGTFARCPNMTHVFLGRNKAIPYVEGLSHLRRLCTLDLSYTAISQDVDIRPLSVNEKSLQHLLLEGTPLHSRLVKAAAAAASAAGGGRATSLDVYQQQQSRYRFLVRGFCPYLLSLDNIMLPGGARNFSAAGSGGAATSTTTASSSAARKIRPEELFDRDHFHQQQLQLQHHHAGAVPSSQPQQQQAAPSMQRNGQRNSSRPSTSPSRIQQQQHHQRHQSRGMSTGPAPAASLSSALPPEQPRSWSAVRQRVSSASGTPRAVDSFGAPAPTQQQQQVLYQQRTADTMGFASAPNESRRVSPSRERIFRQSSSQREQHPHQPHQHQQNLSSTVQPPTLDTSSASSASTAISRRTNNNNNNNNNTSLSFIDTYGEEQIPPEILRFKDQLSHDLDAASVALRTYILVLGSMPSSSAEGKRCVGVVRRSGLLMDSVLPRSIVNYFHWTESELNVPPNSAEDTSIEDSAVATDVSGVSVFGAQLRGKLLRQIHRLNDAKTCLRYITSLAEAGPSQEQLLRVFIERVSKQMF